MDPLNAWCQRKRADADITMHFISSFLSECTLLHVLLPDGVVLRSTRSHVLLETLLSTAPAANDVITLFVRRACMFSWCHACSTCEVLFTVFFIHLLTHLPIWATIYLQ